MNTGKGPWAGWALLAAFALAAGGGTTARAQQSVGQKVIKDQAEYDAYKKALDIKDPAQRGAALEAFVNKYPKSVVGMDALELTVAAYQTAADQPKELAAARHVIELAPNSVRELAIVVAIDRAAGTADQAAFKEGCADAQTGMAQLPSWKKPEGMNDADFASLTSQMGDIFDGEAGFCALENKDYRAARDLLAKAYAINPENLADTYQLAVADVEMDPLEVNGLWYCGKAAALAQQSNNAQAAQGIADYCKAKYARYHGGTDGWDAIAAATASQTAPAPDFAKSIAPAPTPCELAVKVVHDHAASELSLRDWEFILERRDCSPANGEAAAKVWQAVQDLEKQGQARLKLAATVVSATTDSLDVAITEDNQKDNKADMRVVLDKPAATAPAPGTKVVVTGEITKYAPSPFLFTMEKGEVTPASESGAAPQK